jgi:hypothetical protein
MSRELHFTIGTAFGTNPTVQQLSLENDLLLVKAGLLYADRVRLCSIGSSLALEFARLMEASDRQRMEWLSRYFEDLAPTNPEAAATMREFVSMYRDLRRRRGGTRSKSQIQTMFEVQAGMRRIWANFEDGIGEFLRVAGADGIVEALDTGLVALHRFEAGRVERMGGLTPEDQERRSEEQLWDLFWEFFDLISEAVADGETNPLFDKMSGDLLRTGVDAGLVSPTESAVARGRHSGLASDLLQRLPLFERATVQDILSIRQELEGPLLRFRRAVISASEDIRSAAWDEDFPSDADTAFRKVVEPAILEIEVAVRSNSSFSTLLVRGARPGDAATGLSVALGTLAALPDVAALALGVGTMASMSARGAYKEWKENREKIESNQMYFYYGARERLVALDAAPTPTLSLAGLGVQVPVLEEQGAANVNENRSEVEREAHDFMEENEPLLDEAGYAALQRVVTQGSYVGTDLANEVTEAANQYATANRALAEAVRNSGTRPRRIYELERDVEQLRPIYKRKKALHEEFSAFLDRATSAYEREGGEL